jgi:ATP-dependent Zn protease
VRVVEEGDQTAEDRATAFHEAGHAVAALALDRPVVKVSIRPDRDRLGICAFGKAVFRPSEDWLEREVLIALAGMASEAMSTGTYDRAAAARDLRYAHGLALQRAGNERQAERLERRLLAKAENLLERAVNRLAVERIAAELLRAGEISGRQARHLYEECVRSDEGE